MLYSNKTAVVVVDMQDFFLKKLSRENYERIVPNQIKVINFCIKNKIPVVFLEYKNRGKTTKELKRKIINTSAIQTIIKESNSGFKKTELIEILEKSKTKEIVLMGINGSGCVQDTAIGALYRGYKILTSSTVIASSTIRDSNLTTSKKWYSKKGKYFESTDDLLKYIGRNL